MSTLLVTMTALLPTPDDARRQAQELLDSFRDGAVAAYRRFARHHPRFEHAIPEATLGDARFVVARKHSFDN